MNPFDFPKLPLGMRIKIDPFATNGVTEKNLRRQARFRNPFAPEQLSSLREGRADSHRESNLSGGAFFLQFLGLIMRGEGVEDLVQLAQHHEIELVERKADPVVG